MAFYDVVWYCNAGNQSTTGYYAASKRPQNTAVAAGVIRRQFTAPAVGSERLFVCIVAGTTANVTDATWVLTRGAKTTDGTATWQECTGQAALNGDLTNTATWAQVKAATPAVLGQIIKRSNGASYQICTTAGAMSASEPAFSDTAGVTTTDTTAVWTSLGVVGNFTGGGAPHARLANACASTWFADGNTIYVGDNHAESQTTNITITPTTTAIARILCHNHSGSYPPASSDLTTGATITTVNTTATVITFNGIGPYYFHGITMVAASGATSGTVGVVLGSTTAIACWYYFDNCSIQIADVSGTSPNIWLGINTTGAVAIIIFNSTTVKFGRTAAFITPQIVNFLWQNTGPVLVSGSAVPTTFIRPSSSGNSVHSVVLEGLDLSQLTGSLFASPASNGGVGSVLIKDCKLNAVATVTTPTISGDTVQLVRSDSGATACKSTRYAYEGTETTETSITRVGGAADPTGQAQSRKIVTTANSQWLRPFKAEPYGIWNSVTGANVTVTVYGTINAGAVPNNDDIWLEVEYLGDGPSSPLVTFDGVASGVTLSGGNLTATHNGVGSTDGARSATVGATGKYYFEVTPGVMRNGDAIGILLSTGTYVDLVTNGTNCVATYGTGSIWSNNANTGKTIAAWAGAPGPAIGVAIDLGARLAWFRRGTGNWNGDAAANPAIGIGGVTIAASGGFGATIGFGGVAGDSAVANFGQTAFANAAPSGFGNWIGTNLGSSLGTIVTTTKASVLAANAAVASDGSTWNGGGSGAGWSPFKLTATLSSPQPGLAGYIHARVRAAKPSTNYYIDPQIVLS